MLDVTKQPLVACECGCGAMIRSRGTNGSPRRFVVGHAARVQKTSDAKRLRVSDARQKTFASKFDADGKKPCKECDQAYPAEEFYYGGKYRTSCRTCLGSHWTSYERIKAVAKVYKVSTERAETLCAIRFCQICGDPPALEEVLHVDHDHATGEVRGMLCRSCNLTLGYMRDNPELLRSAAAYLEALR